MLLLSKFWLHRSTCKESSPARQPIQMRSLSLAASLSNLRNRTCAQMLNHRPHKPHASWLRRLASCIGTEPQAWMLSIRIVTSPLRRPTSIHAFWWIYTGERYERADALKQVSFKTTPAEVLQIIANLRSVFSTCRYSEYIAVEYREIFLNWLQLHYQNDARMRDSCVKDRKIGV